MSQTARGKQCARTTHSYTGAKATQVIETLTHTQMTVPNTRHLGEIGHINVATQSSLEKKALLQPQNVI